MFSAHIGIYVSFHAPAISAMALSTDRTPHAANATQTQRSLIS